jgi:hypothetical protein
MNDLSTIKDVQAFATAEEYRQAVSDGATDRAQRIRVANPDLTVQFDTIDTVLGK